MSIPKIPFGLLGETIIAWITSHLASPISLLAAAITEVNDLVLAILNLLNPFVFIAVLALRWPCVGRICPARVSRDLGSGSLADHDEDTRDGRNLHGAVGRDRRADWSGDGRKSRAQCRDDPDP